MDTLFYKILFEDEITTIFSLSIFLVFIYSILQIKRGSNKSFLNHAPTTLTTIGILGTFVGIYLGLRGFKVSDIDGSIPALLSGLKIAFITSILGMITALVVKAYQCIRADKNKQVELVTPEHIFGILNETLDIQKKSKQESSQILTDLKKAISSDQDTSLVTQIQKMRTNVVDTLSDLRNDFKSFAEKMAQDNSEALIRALEEVIRDFNSKINEQFGDNFKQLNEAVVLMLDWQKEYKEQVELLNDTFKKTLDGIILIERSINQVEGSVKEIQDGLSPLPDLLKNLQNIVQIIFNETEELDEHLSAFSELKKSAVEAFPVLKENLDKLSAEVSSSVISAIETTEKTLEEFGHQLKER